MGLNSLMSISEAGVLVGVILEGTEYIPPIHQRWPALEKVGFLVLVLALIADWRFQSAINERQTQDLIAARNRIIALSPRAWFLTPEVDKELIAALRPFAGQKVDFVIWRQDTDPMDPTEQSLLATRLRDDVMIPAGWLDSAGKSFAFDKIASPTEPRFGGWGNAFEPIVISSVNALPTSIMVKEERSLASVKTHNAASTLGKSWRRNFPKALPL